LSCSSDGATGCIQGKTRAKSNRAPNAKVLPLVDVSLEGFAATLNGYNFADVGGDSPVADPAA
jgi:hypothetical protein